MIQLSILRGLSLGRLSVIIPKVSVIRLRKSSAPIGFALKVTELLSCYTFPIYFYLKVKINYLRK
jgi:hypothetical protein